ACSWQMEPAGSLYTFGRLRDRVWLPLSPDARRRKSHCAAIRPGQMGKVLRRLLSRSGALDFCRPAKLEFEFDSFAYARAVEQVRHSSRARPGNVQNAH